MSGTILSTAHANSSVWEAVAVIQVRNDGGFTRVVAKDGSKLWNTRYNLTGNQQDLLTDGISNE